jgi:hypothetical protein
MKKTIYILLFTFITLFIINTSYASTIGNDLVYTEIENISAEASEIATTSDSLSRPSDTYIIIVRDDGTIIVIVVL